MRWIQPALQKLWEQKAEAGVKSDTCENKKRTLLGRRLTLNGTFILETHRCRNCKNFTNSCRRTGTNPRVFQTGSSSRACSTTSPTMEVQRCKGKVWTARKKWPLIQQDSDLVIGASGVQDRKRLGNTMSRG